jgi:ribosomal-protein-serine acetyltransferase
MKIEKIAEELRGERIVLKHFFASDCYAKTVFHSMHANIEHVEPYLDWFSDCKNWEETYTWLKTDIDICWNNGTYAQYGVFLENEYIGYVWISHFNHIDENEFLPNKECAIGYWIDKDKIGKGYASEAIKTLETYCFTNGYNKIIITTDKENLPSIKVAEKNNYKLVSRIKDDKTLIYSKLKSEREAF